MDIWWFKSEKKFSLLQFMTSEAPVIPSTSLKLFWVTFFFELCYKQNLLKPRDLG